jgi:hypothetical protein
MSDFAATDAEQELRMDQMRADIDLKRRQAATEWPKTWTAMLVALATIMALIFGTFGYLIGMRSH